MKELYHIIPKGNGYDYLCENVKTGFYELTGKSMRGSCACLKELTFVTLEEANEFLVDHDMFDVYEPELFLVNADYAKELGYE